MKSFTCAVLACAATASLLMPGAMAAQTVAGPQKRAAAVAPTEPDAPYRAAAEALIQPVLQAQPGQAQFDAIDVAAGKLRQSDAATRNAIAWLCLNYVNDKKRDLPYRWPCCYVLTRGGYVEAVPDLIDELLYDTEETMRAVAAEALGGLYMTNGSSLIREALLEAAKKDTSGWVRQTIARYLNGPAPAPTPAPAPAPVPGTPPDDASRRAAQALLQRVLGAPAGQPKFDAIDRVVAEARTADSKIRDALMWLSLTAIKDSGRAPLDRWPCCYIISRSGHLPGVKPLIDTLGGDQLEVMRAVAAEALGGWYKDTGSPVIREALAQAAGNDSSQWVRETVARYLSAPAQAGGSSARRQ